MRCAVRSRSAGGRGLARREFEAFNAFPNDMGPAHQTALTTFLAEERGRILLDNALGEGLIAPSPLALQNTLSAAPPTEFRSLGKIIEGELPGRFVWRDDRCVGTVNRTVADAPGSSARRS